MCACLCAQLCLTLFDPMYCSPPGSSIHGILQARILEWVDISFSKRNYRKKESEVAQSCPTLCDPMDCSLPGSSIHGIFQARVLEWVVISFSIYSLNKLQLFNVVLGWKKHKLESRLLGERSITSDIQMTPPLWQKVKRN